MFTSQTSLIPATVSLIRFFEEMGPAAFSQNYPYWYLGTTPFKYLIGPVTPILFSFAHFALPFVSLLSISIYFVILFSVISGVGWTLLIRMFFKKDGTSKHLIYYIFLTAFYLLMPWKYLAGLGIDELSSFISKCVLPFVLIFIFRYLENRSTKNLIFCGISIALIFLINTNIFISLLTGMFSLAIAFSLIDGKIKRVEKRVKRLFLPLLIGFVISTFWYGPGFWWIQMVSPGIGGGNVAQVASKVLDFVRTIIPMVLAVSVVYFRSKFTERFTVFAWVFFGSFAILSLFRFLANVNFWMDYTAWFTELEVGLFLLSAVIFHTQNSGFRLFIKLTGLLAVSWVITFIIYNTLGRPVLISNKPPQITSSLSKLVDLAKNNTVFITGSNIFWLNVFYDTVQVRGGHDEVSVDPAWRESATKFRESTDPIIIDQALKKLNVKYVLVNTGTSYDFYKDYKNLDVWPTLGNVVAEGNGDIVYKIK